MRLRFTIHLTKLRTKISFFSMYLAEFLSSMYVLHCELWRSAASLMLTNVMGKDPSLRFLAPATYMKPSGRARLPDSAAAAADGDDDDEEEEEDDDDDDREDRRRRPGGRRRRRHGLGLTGSTEFVVSPDTEFAFTALLHPTREVRLTAQDAQFLPVFPLLDTWHNPFLKTC